MIKYICIVIGCLTCISCASTTSLYSWRGYDEAIYAYTEKADETRMRQILKVYEKILKSKGTRGVPAPGICADYGFLLIKASNYCRKRLSSTRNQKLLLVEF